MLLPVPNQPNSDPDPEMRSPESEPIKSVWALQREPFHNINFFHFFLFHIWLYISRNILYATIKMSVTYFIYHLNAVCVSKHFSNYKWKVRSLQFRPINFGHQETSWNVMKCHETSWNVMKCRETSWNVMSHLETSWNIMKRLEMSRNIMKRYEMSWNVINHLETSWNVVKRRETSWNVLKRPETSWNVVKRCETSWNKFEDVYRPV